MNAIAQSLRFKLGDFCRQLFQRPAGRRTPAAAAPVSAAPAPTPTATNDEPSAGGVTLPLRAVLAAFPLELKSRIRPTNTQGLMLTVPFEKVSPQLSHGVVKLPFGDIRRSAPQVFAPGSESDQVSVTLPLHEILSRVNPAWLARRPNQITTVVLPEEISSPFAGRGHGLTLASGNGHSPPAAREPAKETAFTPKPSSPAPPAATITPAAPISIRLPDDPPPFRRTPARLNPTAAPTSPGTPLPPTTPPVWPPKSKDYLAAPPVARSIQPARSDTLTTDSAKSPPLVAPLSALAAPWPEALRQEIAQLNLVNAQLTMPVELIEASLKRGRVTFAWKTLRSWISPAVPPNPSPYDTTELELPLSVVAPLFLSRPRNAGQAMRVTVDETIPDLFSGLPIVEPAPAEADANHVVCAERFNTLSVEDAHGERPKPVGAESGVRVATPNEIVARAAALNGVAGALIALPEGLLVASRVPAESNGDTLAAFLPQVFSKVSQATRELRLGELNNLNFTVGNVPWRIFRVNTLFFAAFGHACGPLPTGELARLAAEMDRRR